MSGDSDNPLARWSRRKLAARQEQELATPEKEQASGEVPEDNAPEASLAEPGLPETEATELEVAEVVEPLPRVEDLTAESDVAAFLKKGVPMALKHAALRKIWSLDPGIRDFVGPSEYAWDFNTPGSMGGFGPLDAKETVVGFLSKAARAIDTVTEPDQATQAAAPSHEQRPDPVPDTALPVEEPEASPAEKPPTEEPPGIEPPVLLAATDVSPSVEFGPHSHSTGKSSPSQLPEVHSWPRHGGAMPR
jgi:hypothetical protein